ncbi:MAG: tyrosine-protein phosphatase [Dehalococcoidales bacterium]|jgi:protein-tyrosine phosphatase
MVEQLSRLIEFEGVLNFRDLGGYQARGGKTVAWRRIFRSGEMHLMTDADTARFKEELQIKTVIDLRSARRVALTGSGRVRETGAEYHNLPFSMIVEGDIDSQVLERFSSAGEIYYYRIRLKEYAQRLLTALEIIAAAGNYPLVFHCNAGKDRSGMLAAVLLGALGVADEDIIRDYTLTAPFMKAFIARWDADPATADVHRNIPAYQKKADAASMALLLNMIKKDYGSVADYLAIQGAETSLVSRLEEALLV